MLDTLSPSPRRSWTRFLRFRLRTLFIAFTLVSIVLGLVGLRWYHGLLEDWAVKDLQDAGARLVTDKHGHTVRVWLSGPTLSDERLSELVTNLIRLPMLNELDLIEAPITDDGLKPLAHLQQIKLLYIHETKATDDGLNELAKTHSQRRTASRKTGPDRVETRRPHRVPQRGRSDGILARRRLAHHRQRRWHTPLVAQDETLPTDTIQAHGDWLFSTAFSPDGKTLATGGGDNLIKLWDVATREADRRARGAYE